MLPNITFQTDDKNLLFEANIDTKDQSLFQPIEKYSSHQDFLWGKGLQTRNRGFLYMTVTWTERHKSS